MLVHEKTNQLLNAFVKNPNGSLIIEGAPESNIEEIVNRFVHDLLQQSHKNNVFTLEPTDKKSIGVEQIRILKQSFMTTVGKSSTGRVALILDAGKLTQEAQNALLKILEEPTSNTVMILCLGDRFQLLETIRSRCINIRILPISKSQAQAYAESMGVQKQEWEKAYLLSGGQSKLYCDILQHKPSLVVERIEDAKNFLKKSVFDRLSSASDYKDYESLLQLIAGLLKVSEAALHSADAINVPRWKQLTTYAMDCEQELKQSASPKLVYLKLATGI